MRISKRNKGRIALLNIFCELYEAHKDFILAKRVANSKPTTWNDAEKLSNLANYLLPTKDSKPQDFMIGNEDKNNNAIDNYIKLKEKLNYLKKNFGVKIRNQLYKAVKYFFRKNKYCCYMDSFFIHLIEGLNLYSSSKITFNHFVSNFTFNLSIFIFTGKVKKINIKLSIEIAKYIFDIIERSKV